MLRSWKLGRAFGIPLYVHATFLLLPAFLLLKNLGAGLGEIAMQLAVLGAIFACVVLHELGHALAARSFGIGTRDITLYPIGGIARLERMSEVPGEELCIALAGPAVNFLIALALTPVIYFAAVSGSLHEGLEPLGFFQDPARWLSRFVLSLWIGNVVLVLFNLLPAFPMDGGRVLRALLAFGLGHRRATDVALRVGSFMAFLIGALAFVPGFGNPLVLVIAGLILFAGWQERLALRYREAKSRQPVVSGEPNYPVLTYPFSPEPGVQDGPPVVGFTGVAWDRDRHVWVRWYNGRPVAVYGG